MFKILYEKFVIGGGFWFIYFWNKGVKYDKNYGS